MSAIAGAPRVRALAHWPRQVLIAAIRIYQLVFSSHLGPACRFEPSCSAYAIGAITRHGVVRGCWLAAARIGRCHPWGGFGYDPVP